MMSYCDLDGLMTYLMEFTQIELRFAQITSNATMHKLPDQHFPNPMRCRVETPHPLDSCGNLTAVKTYVDVTDGPNQHVHVFRSQYSYRSGSKCILQAEQPTIPCLFPNDWEKRKKKGRTGFLTKKELEKIQKGAPMAFHGGCLSYAPVSSSDECAGLLFHPRRPGLNGLSICPLSQHRSEEHDRKVLLYTADSSPPLNYEVRGRLLQIETIPSANNGSVRAAIRTDECCTIFEVTMNDGSVGFSSAIRPYVGDCRPTAVALSPYVEGEYMISQDDGTILVIDKNDRVQPISPQWSDTGQPSWSHYGSHPRLVVTHQRKQLDLLDIRVSSRIASKGLMILPNDQMAHNQEIYISRQHPTNYFYHFVATQDMLMLIDERFPKYQVLQWHHRLTSPPSCLDILSKALPTDDLAVVSSYTSGQSHCVQLSCLHGETPFSTSAPWKVSPYSSVLDLMSELPTCHSFEDVKAQLNQPLIGMCTAKHRDSKGLSVFQVTEVGNVFQQTFHTTTVPISSKSCDVKLSAESEKACNEWLSDALLEKMNRPMVKTKRKLNKFIRMPTTDILKGLKDLPDSNPNCQVCHRTTGNTAPTNASVSPPKQLNNTTEDGSCPVCGVPTNANLNDVYLGTSLKKRRTSDADDTAVFNASSVLESFHPEQYQDPIGKLLLRHWQDGDESKEQDSSTQSDRSASPVPSTQDLFSLYPDEPSTSTISPQLTSTIVPRVGTMSSSVGATEPQTDSILPSKTITKTPRSSTVPLKKTSSSTTGTISRSLFSKTLYTSDGRLSFSKPSTPEISSTAPRIGTTAQRTHTPQMTRIFTKPPTINRLTPRTNITSPPLSQNTPSAPSSSSRMPQGLKAFLDRSHQNTQARLSTPSPMGSSSSPKKSLPRKKLLSQRYSMGF